MEAYRAVPLTDQEEPAVRGITDPAGPDGRGRNREAFLAGGDFQEVNAPRVYGAPQEARNRKRLAVRRERHDSPVRWQVQPLALPAAGQVPEMDRPALCRSPP